MASDPVLPNDGGRDRINAAADQFETDWKAGRRTRLEVVLGQHEPDCRPELLRELLITEWQLRQRDGEPIVISEYLARFPEHRELIEQLVSAGPTVTFAKAAATAEPLERSVVGQYTLLRKLGQGGMGTVFEAEHLKLHKRVALKLLSKGLTRDANSVARFEREMKAVGQLDHPHIVRATDAGEADGQHFLVMDLIDGIDLNDLLKRVGQAGKPDLRIADACELIRQAALGLQYAHEHGLVHRDIKPSNLMLCLVSGAAGLEPIVKVLDFGLALLSSQTEHELTALTSAQQVMGTLDYLAPEQAGDSHQVDIRADLYSLGVTFYKLLTGRTPFADKGRSSPMAKLMAIANETAPTIQSLRPEVPPALAALVHQLMDKQRDRRPANPRDVAASLLPFCTGCDLHALAERVLNRDGRMGTLARPARESNTAEETGKSAHPPSTIAYPPDAPTGPYDVTILTETKSLPASSPAVPKRRWLLAVPILLLVGVTVWLIKSRDGANKNEATSTTSVGQAVDAATGPQPSVLTAKLPDDLAALAKRVRENKLTDPMHADLRQLRQELLDYKVAHWGHPEADLASQLFPLLPWPADALKREDIAAEKFISSGFNEAKDVPAEIVGVIPCSPSSQAASIALSPTGASLLLPRWLGERHIQVWDFPTLEPRTLITDAGDKFTAEFAPDGRSFVLSAHLQHAELRHGHDGRIIGTQTITSPPIGVTCLSGDSKTLAIAGNGVRLFNIVHRVVREGTANGKLVERVEDVLTPRLEWKLEDDPHILFFGVIPHHLFGCRTPYSPGPLVLWDAETGRELRRFTPASQILSVSQHPNGRIVAVSTTQDVKLLDVQTFEERDCLRSPEPRDVKFRPIEYSRNGQYLFTGDNDVGCIHIWEPDAPLDQPQLVKTLRIPLPELTIHSLTATPEGRHLLVRVTNGTVLVLRLNLPERPTRITPPTVADSKRDKGKESARPTNLRVGLRAKADKAMELPAVETVKQKPLSRSALVPRPAPLNGVQSWSVETKGHRGAVWAVAFCPTDDNLLASACDDGVVRLWNTQTGDLVRVLVGHDEAIHDLVWFADGERIATACEDGTVRIWDAKSGRTLHTLEDHGAPVVDLDLSHDGRHLACATAKYTRIWTVADWSRDKDIPQGGFAAWSADDSLLATGGGYKTTVVWNATNGQEHAKLTVPNQEGVQSDSAIWSPTGRILLVAGHNYGTGIEFWDVDEKKVLRRFPAVNVGDVTWSQDGTKIVTAGVSGSVRVWDNNSETQPVEAKFPDPSEVFSGWAECVALTRNGNVVAVGRDLATLDLFDTATGKWIRRLDVPRTNEVRYLAWHPDARRLAVTDEDDRLRVWDTKPAELLDEVSIQAALGVGWSPDGSSLIAGQSVSHGALQHFAVNPRSRLHPLRPIGLPEVAKSLGTNFGNRWIHWFSDAKSVFVAGSKAWNDERSQLIDVMTAQVVDQQDFKIRAFAWSPDEKRMAFSSVLTEIEPVRIWNRNTKQVVQTLTAHTSWVDAIAWSPDQTRLASASRSDGVFIWDMSSSETIHRLPAVSREPVTDLLWLEDGLTLVAIFGDGQAVFWNSDTGKTLRVLKGLGPGLISPDGRKLVSHIPPHWRTARGPFGMMLRTWDTLTGEPGMTLVPLLGTRSSPDAPRQSAWFAVAPDGQVHGSANVEQELVYVVQTDKGQETLTPAEFEKRFPSRPVTP